MRRTLLVIFVTVSSIASVRAQDAPSHVRVSAAGLRTQLHRAAARSPTLRDLLDRLERSPVVVYPVFGRCDGGVDGCLHFAGTAFGCALVKATVNPFGHSEAEVAGLLAHELRHALEVGDAGVLDLAGFTRLYAESGRHGYGHVETDAAADIGRIVQQELRRRKG